MSPAARASYRLPHRRRCTGGRLKYANDGTRPATVAASNNSNNASRRAPKQSYTPARNCRSVVKVAGSIMPDHTGQNRPASRNRAHPPRGVKSQAETAVQISDRHVQNLLETYLALLRASQQDLATLLAPTIAEHGGLIVSLDGLQPEQGNEQLWVVREVLSGTVLGAANLQQATAPMLVPLLKPIRTAGLPVLGGV